VFLISEGGKFDRLKALSSAIYDLTATELQALGAVMQAERVTRKHGWRFMQKVYVRYTGSSSRNFFSNFAIGYVAYADKECLRIFGINGKAFVTILKGSDGYGNSVYTVKQFKEMREKMVAQKQFVDPAIEIEREQWNRARVLKLDDLLDEPAKIRNRKIKPSKAREDDLVSIIGRVGRGLIGTRTKNASSSSGPTNHQEARRPVTITVDWNT
jgi:hypothetical protein